MPKDKTLSHERVIKAAREEFLEKGFDKASMRSIGEKAGMTPAGLYRHYKNKEDMFSALVEPALKDLDNWYEKHMNVSYDIIDSNIHIENLYSNNMVVFFNEVIYKNKEAFTLITKCSKGTKYEYFLHDLILREQKDFKEALDYMKEKGYKVMEMTEFELHMLISAYTTALLEPFMHDLSIEDLEHSMHILEEFFMPGWQKIMGC